MIKVIANASWLVLAEAINKATFFVITIIIARSFGSETFGQFNYVISFVLIFSVLADFGINNLVIREVARNKEMAPKLISNSLVVKIFLSVLTLIVIISSTFFIKKPFAVNVMIYILAFYTIINSYNTFSKSIYRAFESMKHETLLKFIESLVLIFLVIITVLFYKNIYLLTSCFAAAALITFLASLKIIERFFTKFKFSYDKKTIIFLLKEGLPFALAGVFVTVYFNIDTLMVSWIRGDTETGLYSAAYNFIFAALLVPSLLGASLYPVLARDAQDGKLIKRKIFTNYLLFLGMGVVGTILLLLLGKLLIALFFGQAYLRSFDSLKILALILPFSYACDYIGVVLASINRQSIGTIVVFFVALFNIFLNFYLVKQDGYIGASYATLISFAIMFVILSAVTYPLIKKFKLIRELKSNYD